MKTFKQLTKNFDYVNSGIEANFPLQEVGKKVEYKLWHPNKSISTEDALKEIELMGYKPATISHLLSWSDWNGVDIVIALGSVAKVPGHRLCPYLGSSDSARDLDLRWLGGGWGAYCRFLLVRNLSSETRVSEKSLGDLDSLTLRIEKLEEKFKAIKKLL